MNFDFYLQESPGKGDGFLLLSLSERELFNVLNHNYWPESALPGMLKEIVPARFTFLGIKTSKPGEKTTVPSQLERYLESLQIDNAALEKGNYFPNTALNPAIRPGFYVSSVADIFSWSVGKACKENRSLVVITDEYQFRKEHKAGYYSRKAESEDGFSAISTYIDKANNDLQRYIGDVCLVDGWENQKWRAAWVAYKVPESIKTVRRNSLHVRPIKVNSLTNGYDFIIRKDLNRLTEDVIFQSIIEYRESLNAEVA